MSLSSDATFGFYHALGMTFDATPEALKKAFRKASLKCHPDRNPGDDAAKVRFQQINTAHTCLCDPVKRAEYDAVIRMRCVLEQGALTDGTVRDAPLDLVYMFAMKQPGTLGMREDVVLMVNLVEGIAKGRVERWRGGEAVDQRPLSTLRAIDVAPTASSPALKAHFRVENGKASTLQLFARSASDVGTLAALLRALIADHAALHGGGDGNSFSQAAAEKAAERPLMLRVDDETMPPAPKLCAWLALKVASAPSGSKLADLSGAAAAAFKGSTRVFALLGNSKLLLFADRLCAHLKQLITLETGLVHVAHEAEQREFEVRRPPSERARMRACTAAVSLAR
jgi:curved DNA-binding protein CbpA